MTKEIYITIKNNQLILNEYLKSDNTTKQLGQGFVALRELDKYLSKNKIIATNFKLDTSIIKLDDCNIYFKNNLLNNSELKLDDLINYHLSKKEIKNLYPNKKKKRKKITPKSKVASLLALITAVNIANTLKDSDLSFNSNSKTINNNTENQKNYIPQNIEKTSSINYNLTENEVILNNNYQKNLNINYKENNSNTIYNDIKIQRINDLIDLKTYLIENNSNIANINDNLNDPNNRTTNINNVNNSYELSSNVTPELQKEFIQYLNSSEGKYILNYASDYGIDPYLMLSIAMSESRLLHNQTLPGGKYYSGYGWGLFQHFTPNNVILEAYNFNTNTYDSEILSEENLRNVETNIKLAAMKLQTCLNKYNNVYLALQAYNGGEGYVNIVMSKLSNEYVNKDSIPLSIIMNEFKYLSTNTKEYINNLPNNVIENNPVAINTLKNYNTYANANYISKVMGYYLGNEGIYKTLDNNNNTIIKIFSYNLEIFSQEFNLNNNKTQQLIK